MNATVGCQFIMYIIGCLTCVLFGLMSRRIWEVCTKSVF